MNLSEAKKLVQHYLATYGLLDWSVEFVKVTSYYGITYQEAKVFKFSTYLLECNEADLIDTILHEIAHALVGCHHSHDKVWRRKARELGCKDLSATAEIKEFSIAVLKDAKYVVEYNKKVIRAYFRKPKADIIRRWETGMLPGCPETNKAMRVVPYNAKIHREYI